MQGVTEPCGECGFDPSLMTDGGLGPESTRLAQAHRGVISSAADQGSAALTVRPSDDVWSIQEYVGHVAFIYERLADMAVADGQPVVDGVDPDEHVSQARFNEIAAAEMSRRIGDVGDRVGVALSEMPAERFGEAVLFNGNPVPFRLLAVAFVHESAHHLRDVERLLADG
jgi:hypothetical protein